MARILLVDDDDMIRETFRPQLEHAGHEVMTAKDGMEALVLLAEHQADLVVTDIIMPEKEGIETILEIKQIQPTARVLAISGGGRAGRLDFLKIAREFGAERTLRKPFTPRQLIRVIAECLGEAKAEPAPAA